MLIVQESPALPVIDMSPFVAAQDDVLAITEAQLATAKEIHAACAQAGFFYVVGHGVSEEQATLLKTLARDFFSLEPETKARLSIYKNDMARGYQRLGENITQYKQDWHEGLDYYAPVNADLRGSKVLTGSNPYPSPEFQAAVEEYVTIMRHLGMAIMRAIALGLGLSKDFFNDKMCDSFWVLRLIGYPPLDTQEAKGDSEKGISCGEHTDYGCLTILNTDDTPGALQVKNKAGDWISADPIPGAFVINIGDMLNVWTNNVYTATLHRVIHTGQNYRVSIPFFFEPNWDIVVAPIPGIGEEAKCYGPVKYGDHLYSKVANNFDKDGRA